MTKLRLTYLSKIFIIGVSILIAIGLVLFIFPDQKHEIRTILREFARHIF